MIKDQTIKTDTELDEVTEIKEFQEEESTTKITESVTESESVTKDQKIEIVTEINKVTKIEEFKEDESTTEVTESYKESATKD